MVVKSEKAAACGCFTRMGCIDVPIHSNLYRARLEKINNIFLYAPNFRQTLKVVNDVERPHVTPPTSSFPRNPGFVP